MVDNDFSYKVNDNDKSLKFMLYKENYFGYKHASPTNFSMELKDLRNEIFFNEEITKDLEFSKNGIDFNYVKNSKKMWNELGFNLQKIQYLKPTYNFDEKTFDGNLTKDFYDSLIIDYPTELPIKFVNDFMNVNIQAIYFEFEKHNSIFFRYINLPKLNKLITSSIYAHEITHIEQENAGGGMNLITNQETLPIFIELLFSKTLDESGALSNIIINHRLTTLAAAIGQLLNNKEMNFEERIIKETYLISIIQAIDLFNKYKDSSEEVKKELINSINKLFIGEIIIDDILDKFDSNFKDIDLDLKTLKR